MSAADWKPAASARVIRERAALLARVRGFFEVRGVLEVQTPLLSASAASDPQIESLRVEARDGGVRYLATSPEFAMKRLLAAGLGDCYQVGPAFRDGESGRLHNPEFTMVEWYRTGLSAESLQAEVEALLQVVAAGHRDFPPARRVAYRDALLEACGVDCDRHGPAEIRAALAAAGIRPAHPEGFGRDDWLDLLMGSVIGPGLGRDAPVIVADYPPSQASLARLRELPDGRQVAERFELYIDGIEIANGFRELGDAVEQRARFEQDRERRRRRGQRQAPLDERLLAALAHGLPDCAGVALGFDRLVMVALRLPDLDSALCFPAARA